MARLLLADGRIEDAWQRIDQIADPLGRSYACARLVKELDAATEPSIAIEKLRDAAALTDQISSSKRRDQIRADIAGNQAEWTDVEGALGTLARLNVPPSNRLFINAINSIVKASVKQGNLSDARAVLSRVRDEQGGLHARLTYLRSLATWVSMDHAKDAAQRIDDNTEKAQAYVELAKIAARSQDAQTLRSMIAAALSATDRLRAKPQQDQPQKTLAMILKDLADLQIEADDHLGAAEAARHIQAPDLRRQSYRDIARAHVRAGSHDSARLIVRSHLNGPHEVHYANQVYEALAGALSEAGRLEEAEWTIRHIRGFSIPSRVRAYRKLAAQWAGLARLCFRSSVTPAETAAAAVPGATT